MNREIRIDHPAIVRPIPANPLGDIRDWLQAQAAAHDWGLQPGQPIRLLAHADDGVIWGRIDSGVLVIARDVAGGNEEVLQASPELRPETLQQARLFGPRGELLLWRDGDNPWHARLICDVPEGEEPAFRESLDELQMLWGTHGRPLDREFTLLRDGAQGLRHAVPWPCKLTLENKSDTEGKIRPPRLRVRHYLDKKDPFARIVASRLVNLEEDKEPNS